MINSFIIVKLTTSLKGYAILDPYVFQAHTFLTCGPIPVYEETNQWLWVTK